MTRLLTGLPLLVLAACAQPAPEASPGPAQTRPAAEAPTSVPTPAATPALTAEGWGPLRIGMTRAEVERIVGPDAEPQAVGGPNPESCEQFRPERAPKGMLLMVENGRLTRISLIKDSVVTTDRSLALGSKAESVVAAYGNRLVMTPHKYQDTPAQYLDVWEPKALTTSVDARKASTLYIDDPSARGIRYEVGEQGRVTMIHAGGPSIQYVEGCA